MKNANNSKYKDKLKMSVNVHANPPVLEEGAQVTRKIPRRHSHMAEDVRLYVYTEHALHTRISQVRCWVGSPPECRERFGSS